MSENTNTTPVKKSVHKSLKPAQAAVLRVLCASDEGLTYEQVEKAMGLANKTGIFAALGGLWNKGIVAHVDGPVPAMSTNRVPQAVFDTATTKFQVTSREVRELCALLGLV